MKIIGELNDQMILGQEGMSDKAPRRTARAIVRNTDGLYAVMYADKFGLYSLPGGGVEDGEDVLTALKREVLEETGCTCGKILELGLVRENRACQDYTQESYYYVVTAAGCVEKIHLTETEQESNMSVQWHTFDEMVRLISAPEHTNIQRKYLQARDLAALKAYMEDGPAMMEIEVLDDIGDGQLLALENSFLAEIGEELMDGEKQERLRRAHRGGKITFFMARYGSKAVGMCSVSKSFSTFSCADVGVFDDFFVEPAFRGKGIARKLAETAQAWCKANGIDSLTVCCAPCDEGMYQALGFDVHLGNTYACLS